MGFYRCNPKQGNSDFDISISESANTFYTQKLFENQSLFNSKVAIGKNIMYCVRTFFNCRNWNKEILFEEGGTQPLNCQSMFASCNNFNQPVVLPSRTNDCSYTFQGCSKLNSPITFGANVYNCCGTFYTCSNFNQPVTIPSEVTHCESMFRYCYNLNQPITISKSAINCKYMFSECNSFNQDIVVPSNVTDLQYMFNYCSKFACNIYLNYNSSKTYMYNYMLAGTNRSLRKNIFCKSIAGLTYSSAGSTVTGEAMSWSSSTNCLYNAYYNIYVYNNYTGTA